MAGKFDQQVSVLAEKAARRLTRRSVIAAAVKSGFAVVTGIFVGQGLQARRAEAEYCPCNWNYLPDCTAVWGSCPYYGGCPSGCTVCKFGDPPTSPNGYGCNGYCPYQYGNWVSCTGLGGGLGYKICTDCKCSTCYGTLCTCLSGCLNCDVRPQP